MEGCRSSDRPVRYVAKVSDRVPEGFVYQEKRMTRVLTRSEGSAGTVYRGQTGDYSLKIQFDLDPVGVF